MSASTLKSGPIAETAVGVKAKLARGEPVTGIMVFEFSTPGMPQLVARAGLDFIVFDMESSGLSWESLRVLLLASHAAGISPIVRLGVMRADNVGRALDLGATGFMVPKIETSSEATALVGYTRFPPEGTRGSGHEVGTGVPSDLPMSQKMILANASVFLLCQIETIRAVENCAEIAAVPGIDALSIGINDLTASMGIPGEFENPKFREAVDHVKREALAKGKHFAGVVAHPNKIRDALKTGQRVLFLKHDRALLSEAIKQYAQQITLEADSASPSEPN